MSIQPFVFNYAESFKLYKEYKELIRVKECFNNTFKIVTNGYAQDNCKKGIWQVAYGAMPSIENLVVNHCFLVNSASREVIDATPFCASNPPNPDNTITYYAYYVFEDIQAYFKEVERNNYFPSLPSFIRKYANAAQVELLEQGLFLVG